MVVAAERLDEVAVIEERSSSPIVLPPLKAEHRIHTSAWRHEQVTRQELLRPSSLPAVEAEEMLSRACNRRGKQAP